MGTTGVRAMIQIKVLQVATGATSDVFVEGDDSVLVVKRKVCQVTQVAEASQRLIWQGKLLNDTDIVENLKLPAGATIHLVAKPPPPPPGQDGNLPPPPLVQQGAPERRQPAGSGNYLDFWGRKWEARFGAMFTVFFTVFYFFQLFCPAVFYAQNGGAGLTGSDTPLPSLPAGWCNSTCQALPLYNGPQVGACDSVASSGAYWIIVGFTGHVCFVVFLAVASPNRHWNVWVEHSCFCGIFVIGFVFECINIFGDALAYNSGKYSSPEGMIEECRSAPGLTGSQQWAHYRAYGFWAVTNVVVLCLVWLSFFVPKTGAFLHGMLMYPANGFPLPGRGSFTEGEFVY